MASFCDPVPKAALGDSDSVSQIMGREVCGNGSSFFPTAEHQFYKGSNGHRNRRCKAGSIPLSNSFDSAHEPKWAWN